MATMLKFMATNCRCSRFQYNTEVRKNYDRKIHTQSQVHCTLNNNNNNKLWKFVCVFWVAFDIAIECVSPMAQCRSMRGDGFDYISSSFFVVAFFSHQNKFKNKTRLFSIHIEPYKAHSESVLYRLVYSPDRKIVLSAVFCMCAVQANWCAVILYLLLLIYMSTVKNVWCKKTTNVRI